MKKVTIKKLKRAKIKKKQFVVKGVETRPRITVCRSLKHLSAQAIDDTKHRTLCEVSTTLNHKLLLTKTASLILARFNFLIVTFFIFLLKYY